MDPFKSFALNLRYTHTTYINKLIVPIGLRKFKTNCVVQPNDMNTINFFLWLFPVTYIIIQILRLVAIMYTYVCSYTNSIIC